MFGTVPSQASDAIIEAQHPLPCDGGPCATCAFRKGTEANQTPHTLTLARLCVEGIRSFYCHEQPGLCRGFVAAVNLRGVPETKEDRRWKEVNAMAADLLADLIADAKRVDEAHHGEQPEAAVPSK